MFGMGLFQHIYIYIYIYYINIHLVFHFRRDNILYKTNYLIRSSLSKILRIATPLEQLALRLQHVEKLALGIDSTTERPWRRPAAVGLKMETL